MEDFERIRTLLKLKSHESPGGEFFQDFLHDFRERQRSDMLRKSSVSLLLERASMWWNGLGNMKWALAPAACAAAVMFFFLFSGPAATPANNGPIASQASPAPAEATNALPTLPGQFEPRALQVGDFDDPVSLLPTGPLDHLTEILPDEKADNANRYRLIVPSLIEESSEGGVHSLRDSP